jgi:hypothetical protein
MKKIFLLNLLLIFSLAAKAQVSKNAADLEALYLAIQKLPSYKDQVKNNPQLNYNFSKDFAFSEKEGAFEVFIKLYKLIAPIRDNHLAFYSNKDSLLAKPALAEIAKSTIDSAISAQHPKDSVAGTYYYETYKMELVKIKEYYVSVVESKGKYYTQFLLAEVTPNHFDLISFRDNGRKYFINRNVVFVNQRLSGTPYKKYQQNDFINIPSNVPVFEVKQLDESTTYLRLGNFGTSTKNIEASVKFYSQIGELSTPNLIVDLRNNGGGGYKNSGKFLSLIKKFKGKVHLLVNNYTISNAEQFTLDLMDSPNVTTYGERTRGTICYGSNVGAVVDLPSKRFSFYITDMKTRKKDLPFESIGIAPKVELNIFEKDWINQVMGIIKSKK